MVAVAESAPTLTLPCRQRHGDSPARSAPPLARGRSCLVPPPWPAEANLSVPTPARWAASLLSSSVASVTLDGLSPLHFPLMAGSTFLSKCETTRAQGALGTELGDPGEEACLAAIPTPSVAEGPSPLRLIWAPMLLHKGAHSNLPWPRHSGTAAPGACHAASVYPQPWGGQLTPARRAARRRSRLQSCRHRRSARPQQGSQQERVRQTQGAQHAVRQLQALSETSMGRTW